MIYIEIKGKKYPIGDALIVLAGAYIGYKEGKGLEVSKELEYLTKYGPTAITPPLTATSIALTKAFSQILLKQKPKIENETFVIKGGKLSEFPLRQKEKIKQKALENITKAEELNKQIKFGKPILKNTTKTALESLAGYVIGRAASQII